LVLIAYSNRQGARFGHDHFHTVASNGGGYRLRNQSLPVEEAKLRTQMFSVVGRTKLLPVVGLVEDTIVCSRYD